MTITNEIGIKSDYLLQELGNWKLVAIAYGDLIDKNTFLKEFLAFKMDIAQGFIEELQVWEEIGNETKCKKAIENAVFFLGQIQTLFDRVIAGRYQETWRKQEEELIFTDYIHVS